ncbi:MAG: RNA 2',3'-cyclic phosphodiesterase [Chloroflexi bacterium]|nr:RNA 2',3'-cyclic phosphodiesterase [Chloroflexota bacterium]
MAMIRAFVAVQLPAEVRTELGLMVDVLAGQTAERSVRWVKPELIHLTLRFLGDTAVANLPGITIALDRAGQQAAPFSLRLGSLGCFPNPQRPRVIWVGLDGDKQPLLALKQAVDTALQPLGWAVETRPFQAHLTLGRVNDGRQATGLHWRTEVRPLAVPVTAVHLIESQLQRGGPVYTVRHSSHLLG